MGYVSITKLSLLIQEKLNKLNAGNLSEAELDELKDLTGELNERIVILHYKSKEMALLKQADDILTQKTAPKVEEPSIAEPIKLSFEVPVEVKSKPPVEQNIVQETVLPKTEVKPTPVAIAAEPILITKTENQSNAKVSLVERMQKTKVNDLKTAIGLNQKFLFMNFLFEGENNSYNDAIEKLNNMPTAADARHYIRELSYIYNWNFEDENVVLFTEYVERRHL